MDDEGARARCHHGPAARALLHPFRTSFRRALPVLLLAVVAAAYTACTVSVGHLAMATTRPVAAIPSGPALGRSAG